MFVGVRGGESGSDRWNGGVVIVMQIQINIVNVVNSNGSAVM